MPKPYRFNDEFKNDPQWTQHSPSPIDELEPLPQETQAALFAQMAELLTPVILFLSKGNKTGTLDVRNWVFLYSVRPDLIGNETMEAYAKRRGVSHAAVSFMLTEFRRTVPAFRFDTVKGRPIASVKPLRQTIQNRQNLPTKP